MSLNPLLLAFTGASGAPYGLRLMELLLQGGRAVDLILSNPARVVLKQECGLELHGDGPAVVDTLLDYFNSSAMNSLNDQKRGKLRHFALDDWYSPAASGSGGERIMVICPCSMGSLARIRHGLSGNLIERAADVTIKEGGRLILVPRESPYSTIHLDNMLALSKLGVTLLPASPGFYYRPDSIQALIDFVVARILNQLGVVHDLTPGWPEKAQNHPALLP
ncbi:MAG: UbiX family flavin prenyltransferase [Magnetococcales bacterium]|nr:UbiX family flavin prenyltransferase [Magnetococcales bacterium]